MRKFIIRRNWIFDIFLFIVIVALTVLVYFHFKEKNGVNQQTSENAKLEVTEVMSQELSEGTQTHEGSNGFTVQSALPFSLSNLEGEIVALSDFAGTPIMVNFWATWCPPCRAEMPLIQEFAATHQGELVVLAINAGEDKAIVKNFTENNDLSDLYFLLDPELGVANLYRLPGFPTSLFIDPDGLLHGIHIGELDETLLVNYLAEIGVKE